MTVRTTKKTVTFVNPFTLGDSDEIFPPGTYEVETDEELLEGLSFRAYRRTLTLIHLPGESGIPGLSQVLTIDPNELDAALKRDAASGTDTSKRGDAETDSRAEGRAEDEGMIVHPH